MDQDHWLTPDTGHPGLGRGLTGLAGSGLVTGPGGSGLMV